MALSAIHTRNIKGDLYGGVTAAVVALPISIGFWGVFRRGGDSRSLWRYLCRTFCGAVWRHIIAGVG